VRAYTENHDQLEEHCFIMRYAGRKHHAHYPAAQPAQQRLQTPRTHPSKMMKESHGTGTLISIQNLSNIFSVYFFSFSNLHFGTLRSPLCHAG